MTNSTLTLIETAALTTAIVAIVLIWYTYLESVSKKIRQKECKHKSWSQYGDGKTTKRTCWDCDKELEPIYRRRNN